jgi:hypothetical protein
MTKSTWRMALFAGAILAAALGHDVLAGDSEEEKKKLVQCATDLCSIILSKNPKGPDLSCDLTKTWDEKQVQKGADSKNVAWGLGSVKCSLKISLKRADIAAALSSSDGKFKTGKQTVACEIGDDRYPIRAAAAPELKFKNGTNTEASLHVEDIDGAPLIQGAVWTAAQLERHFGVFEKDIVREVNHFIQKECPKFVGPAK